MIPMNQVQILETAPILINLKIQRIHLMAQAKPTTSTVLTSVDRSTKALNTAADTLVKATQEQAAQVVLLTGQLSNLATDIQVKQSELGALNDELATNQRENAAELRLRIKEDREKVLKELLQESGLVAKTPAEIKEVQAQLAEALSDNQDALDAVKETVTATLTQQYTSRISTLESDHKVAIAQLNANTVADQRAIASQAEQIAQLRSDLAEERKVRVQTEEARSRAQGVVVNASGK